MAFSHAKKKGSILQQPPKKDQATNGLVEQQVQVLQIQYLMEAQTSRASVMHYITCWKYF
jgi:hypothetical protein